MANQLLGAGWFLMTPEVVVRDSRLNKLQQNIYSELFTFQNATPNQPIWISNGALAKKYKIKSTETISRAIGKLVEYGYIKRQLVYKDNSMEIEKRLLRVVPLDEIGGTDNEVNRVLTDESRGYRPRGQGGTDCEVKENIPSNIPVNKPMNIPEDDDEQVINTNVKKAFNENNLQNQNEYSAVVTKRLLPLVKNVDSVKELNAMFDDALKDAIDKSNLGKVQKPVSYAITIVSNAVDWGAKNYDQFMKFNKSEQQMLNQDSVPKIVTDIDIHSLDLTQLRKEEQNNE
ncbi:hypothetical protein [Weissella minor]|uniref:hypothetical protein n=1 Tax=Weissella minor TaxID=1620 RepID=UPI003AF28959